MIERQIVTGLIASTEYIRQIHPLWNPLMLESATARRLAIWCMDYFEQYGKAPEKDIQGIYYSNLKQSKLPKESAEEIEEILSGLSDDYSKEGINVDYLVNETKIHFTRRRLENHSDMIKSLTQGNQLVQAERIACNYRPVLGGSETDLDLTSEEILDKIDGAFDNTTQNVVRFPFALGDFWNDQFVKGGLVALLSPEKRGKTFMLIDIAIRAWRKKKRVAFFQAGDLSEFTFLKRICINLAQRSDKEKYCTKHFQPVADCYYNQTNNCKKEERRCNLGPFEGEDPRNIKELKINDLISAYNDFSEYRPCVCCPEYRKNRWGALWIEEIDKVDPLTSKEAKEYINSIFVSQSHSFRLSTHPNDTLTLSQIRAHLEIWERQDEFVPDLIVIDYADLLVPEVKTEFRHQQNEIWKGLRRLSQEKGQPLVVTATQSDANSYDADKLRLKNFSEDKRKYAHATAFYGLNQDSKGEEKRKGIMRINELLLREDEFDVLREITILQNLRRGMPIVGSYWSI